MAGKAEDDSYVDPVFEINPGDLPHGVIQTLRRNIERGGCYGCAVGDGFIFLYIMAEERSWWADLHPLLEEMEARALRAFEAASGEPPDLGYLCLADDSPNT